MYTVAEACCGVFCFAFKQFCVCAGLGIGYGLVDGVDFCVGSTGLTARMPSRSPFVVQAII